MLKAMQKISISSHIMCGFKIDIGSNIYKALFVRSSILTSRTCLLALGGFTLAFFKHLRTYAFAPYMRKQVFEE